MDANEDVTLAFLARRHRRSIKRSIVLDCICMFTLTWMILTASDMRVIFASMLLVSSLELIGDMRLLNDFDRMPLLERGRGG